jgi:hypothetical protein
MIHMSVRLKVGVKVASSAINNHLTHKAYLMKAVEGVINRCERHTHACCEGLLMKLLCAHMPVMLTKEEVCEGKALLSRAQAGALEASGELSEACLGEGRGCSVHGHLRHERSQRDWVLCEGRA